MTFVVLGLLFLIGCEADQPGQTISFAFAGDGAELAAYQTLITAFEEVHPDFSVEIRHAPSRQDFEQKLITMFDAGSPPDVALLNYRRVARFAADGDLTPIEFEQLADDPADFYPIALEAFTHDETVWCMPQNISSLVVYFNRDLFDEAGIPYPAEGWDWARFLATAQRLKAADKLPVGIEPNLYRLSPFLWQAGGGYGIKSAELLPITAENLAALTFLTELQTVHGVAPNQIETESLSIEDRFLVGELGILFESRRFTPILRQAAEFQWDVVSLPRGAMAAGVLHSDGYCLGREPSEATLAFVRFAVSETGQGILAETGRTVPSRIKIANSDRFLNSQQSPSNSRVWLDGIEQLRLVPWHPRWTELEKLASAEIEQVFFGAFSPEEALVRINSKTATLLEKDP